MSTGVVRVFGLLSSSLKKASGEKAKVFKKNPNKSSLHRGLTWITMTWMNLHRHKIACFKTRNIEAEEILPSVFHHFCFVCDSSGGGCNFLISLLRLGSEMGGACSLSHSSS